jgi:glycosyltransferase involved in cell wall biosynthesis
MTVRAPGVSIGLPVYNGGTMLAEALDSILAQTYRDLEIVITDNASTDSTQAIAEQYAAQDPRIRYLRNDRNIGAPENFNRAFAESTRALFKWASHDDLLAPTFIQRCVDALQAEPDTVLAFSRIIVVDGEGTIQKELPTQLPATRDRDPARRFAAVATERHGGFPLWGVMRAEALGSTSLHQPFPGGDKVLLAEMALRGRFAEVQEPLFLLRAHGGRSVAAMPSIYLRARWHDPDSNPRLLAPHWRMARGFVRAIEHAPLGRRPRRAAQRSMVLWVVRNWNWARLLMDGVVVVVPSAWRLFEAGRAVMRARDRRRRDRTSLGTGGV